jgi:hypothetical protein
MHCVTFKLNNESYGDILSIILSCVTVNNTIRSYDDEGIKLGFFKYAVVSYS